ncbi:ATP-binding protein [Phenylobacterium sp.]|uniref:ATP-binding protein n=1 Tax=Phenylobacterium sp. TaxID=1871053 RepID=UPI00286A4975|nr:ATP-binding protein [Phenylobacterium sp.]
MSTYQLTLLGLVKPYGFNVAFNALAGICLVLLGHPIIAGLAFVAYCAIDAVNLALVRRWIAAAAGVDPDAGFRRLAPLCTARIGVYVIPSVIVAMGGHPAELLFFAVQVWTLVAVATSAGMMSRRIYWGFVSPLIAAAAVLAGALVTPLAALALLLSLVTLALLLGLMLETTVRTISGFHDAYNANLAMIPELEAARDRALAERTAADQAREEARRANRAKSNFLATMSHEIRTPLNGVLGMAQLLRRDETQPHQLARIDTLMDSGEHLLSILNDILDVSKIDAGTLEIHTGVEDLRLFLDRLVSFWSARAEDKGVSLILDADDDLPPFVRMDALRLRQVMFNLIGNALKFTETGAVTVAAAIQRRTRRAVWLRLSVRDSGVGVATEHLPLLFERFSQADESDVRKFGGTGLGLSIARQFTELMDGRIWAESRPGEGSTFHIELPLRLATPGTPRATAHRPAPTPEPAADLRPLAVLAVDDNAVNLTVLDQLLSALGHEVTKAASGAEALQMLAQRPFDLVLMDIQMPGMTGIEALSLLRETPGANRAVPVIALTADVTSGGREHYRALGFTEHGAKPIEVRDLMEAMARALEPSTAPILRKRAPYAT